MTTEPVGVGTGDALAPVRAALLASARADAATALAQADADAEAELTAGNQEAAAIREEARAQGAADAEAALAAERTRARREARVVLLESRSEVLADLRRAVRAGLDALRSDPDYPALLDVLASRARAALGPEATVTEDPEGGVVAEAGPRRAAFTLAGLADRALAELGPELEGLWRP